MKASTNRAEAGSSHGWETGQGRGFIVRVRPGDLKPPLLEATAGRWPPSQSRRRADAGGRKKGWGWRKAGCGGKTQNGSAPTAGGKMAGENGRVGREGQGFGYSIDECIIWKAMDGRQMLGKASATGGTVADDG
jgi:hypothetical protein